MMATTARRPITLALHPSVAGFGWIAMESPVSPYDWGLAFTSVDKNANCLKRAERMFDRFMPETLVLEAFDAGRNERIKRLCHALIALAQDRGVEVAIYARDDIKATFAHAKPKGRHEMAEAVGRHLPMLQKQVPKKRRAWESEPPVLAVFSAAAGALTHYRLSCQLLLDHLKDVA